MKTKQLALDALKRIVEWNSRPLDSGQDAGRGVTRIQLAQAGAAITALEADIAQPVEPPVLIRFRFYYPDPGEKGNQRIGDWREIDPWETLPEKARDVQMIFATPQEPAAPEWMPIESAPKNENETGRTAGDCQHVLLLFGKGIRAVGYWDSYYSEKYGRNGLCWIKGTSGEQLEIHYGHPIGWMPLPQPPKATP